MNRSNEKNRFHRLQAKSPCDLNKTGLVRTNTLSSPKMMKTNRAAKLPLKLKNYDKQV